MLSSKVTLRLGKTLIITVINERTISCLDFSLPPLFYDIVIELKSTRFGPSSVFGVIRSLVIGQIGRVLMAVLDGPCHSIEFPRIPLLPFYLLFCHHRNQNRTCPEAAAQPWPKTQARISESDIRVM